MPAVETRRGEFSGFQESGANPLEQAVIFGVSPETNYSLVLQFLDLAEQVNESEATDLISDEVIIQGDSFSDMETEVVSQRDSFNENNLQLDAAEKLLALFGPIQDMNHPGILKVHLQLVHNALEAWYRRHEDILSVLELISQLQDFVRQQLAELRAQLKHQQEQVKQTEISQGDYQKNLTATYDEAQPVGEIGLKKHDAVLTSNELELEATQSKIISLEEFTLSLARGQYYWQSWLSEKPVLL